MKKILINSSLVILGAIFLFSFFSSKELLVGKWRNEKYGVEVLIFKHKNLYFGNVTEAGNAKGNEKIKNGPMQVLQNFSKTSDSTYCCGTLYLPKVGMHVNATITVIDNEKLEVVGYLLGIKTTLNWVKIK